jgi:hypothetical protein
MFSSFLRIPRKVSEVIHSIMHDTHAIPSLLTGYPQVAKFSGDDVLFSWSAVPYLSRGDNKKDGSIKK